MSRLIDARTILDETNLSTMKSVILDMSETDFLSVGIHVSAATGSNLLDLHESVDGINYIVVASLVITEPSDTIWHVYPVFSKWKKILYTPSSGSASFTVTINTRNTTVGSTGQSFPVVTGDS